MKPISKLLCLLILLSASAYANEVRSNSAEQSTAKRIIAQNNNDCKQIHNNQTNEIVMMCRDAYGQYQKVEQDNVDDNIVEPSTPAFTENEIADKKTEYIELKQEWKSKLSTASGNELMMIYTGLIELAPDVGERNMVKQYIRDMAFAWVRDGTQPGQECGFLKAVYEGQQDINPSQEDILEIEYPFAKSCFKAGATPMAAKLLDASFNRILRGVKLKDPDRINEMLKLADEIGEALEKSNNSVELVAISESTALIYFKKNESKLYKDNNNLKTVNSLVRAANFSTQKEKQDSFYKKAVAVLPNTRDQYNMGLQYLDGKLVTQSDRNAVFWFKNAADHGLAEAQNNLGTMLSSGRGVNEDKTMALYWHKKAAEQNLVDAQLNVGVDYEQQGNYIESLKWFTKAANQGNMLAQFNLAHSYQYGSNGIKVDYKKAIFWYEKAANNGLAEAQANLGYLYGNALGTSLNIQKANYWYRKSAEQANPTALFNLALSYVKDERGIKNYYAAYILFSLAKQYGHEKASKGKEIALEKLTENEVSKAKEAITNWKPGIHLPVTN